MEGTATPETSQKTIAQLYNEYEYYSKLWKGPDDPTLIVFKATPAMYDYMKPGEWASVQLTP